MASEAELLIRVLADTGSAESSVNQLISTMGKVAGVGVAGAAAGAMVSAAMMQQDAMAKIATSYNSVDFTEGSTKYKAAHDFIIDESTKLATNFETLAGVYAQGARFVDDYGNRLPTAKVQEYTETMARLAKVSTDAMSPEQIGQSVDVFEKLFGQTNFANVGSAISALSGIHNQGEQPVLSGAVAIGQYGAQLGVTQAQALGLANYLADLGSGGSVGAGGPGMAGASIGRMLMLMDQSADNVLDPTENYKNVVKQREAAEKVDDLQSDLGIAEAKRSEMFDSRGRMKRNFLRHPSEVMAEDARIAKMHRELGDAQSDQAHLAEEGLGTLATGRGTMNIGAMAGTAGEDTAAFAQQFKDSPVEALLAFTRGLHNMDETKRGEAIRAAGIKNIRDLKTIEQLAARPDVIQQYIDLAQGQIDNPTDLTGRSDIKLDTTSSKVTDVKNAAQAGAAALGEGPRQMIDAGAQKLLDELHTNSDALTKLSDSLTGDPLKGTIAAGVVAGLVGAVPVILSSVVAGTIARTAAGGIGGSAVAGTGAQAITAGAAGASGLGGILGTAGAAAAVAAPFAATEAYKAQMEAMGNESQALLAGLSPMQRAALDQRLKEMGETGPDTGVAPGELRQALGELHINVPQVSVTVATSDGKISDPGAIAQQVYNAVIGGITQAWQRASSAPSPQLGGAR